MNLIRFEDVKNKTTLILFHVQQMKLNEGENFFETQNYKNWNSHALDTIFWFGKEPLIIVKQYENVNFISYTIYKMDEDGFLTIFSKFRDFDNVIDCQNFIERMNDINNNIQLAVIDYNKGQLPNDIDEALEMAGYTKLEVITELGNDSYGCIQITQNGYVFGICRKIYSTQIQNYVLSI